ncbi:MAG: GIN domain-containing protein [Candidatus Electrothrix sp. YB6]
MKKRMFFGATELLMLLMVFGLFFTCTCLEAGSVSYTATGGVSLISVNGGAGEMTQDTGVTKTETRKFPAYRSIAIDNFPGKVTVRCNGQSNAAVTADQAVLPAIRTAVENSTLFIGLTKSITTQMPLQIFLNAEDISSLQIDGVSDVVMEDVVADRLHLQLDGSGSITAAGKVAELEAVLTGSGDLKLSGLVAEQCTVRIDGAGDAEVHVTGVLNAEIDGAGDIVYFGTPSEVIKKIDGAGDIESADH